MDITAFTQLISSVGFPIACCIFMGWYVKYTTDKHREELADLNNQHRIEMSNMTEAINNNTVALTELKGVLMKEVVEHDNIHD